MPGVHTDKQKRQARHIKESEKKRGHSEKEAESIAWATVNSMKSLSLEVVLAKGYAHNRAKVAVREWLGRNASNHDKYEGHVAFMRHHRSLMPKDPNEIPHHGIMHEAHKDMAAHYREKMRTPAQSAANAKMRADTRYVPSNKAFTAEAEDLPLVILEKAAPPLGSGARFKKLKGKLSHRSGVRDPGALAATIGRKKYGAKRFAKLAHKAFTGEVEDMDLVPVEDLAVAKGLREGILPLPGGKPALYHSGGEITHADVEQHKKNTADYSLLDHAMAGRHYKAEAEHHEVVARKNEMTAHLHGPAYAKEAGAHRAIASGYKKMAEHHLGKVNAAGGMSAVRAEARAKKSLEKAGPGSHGGVIDHYTADGRPVYTSQEKTRRDARKRRKQVRRMEKEAERVERQHAKDRKKTEKKRKEKSLVIDPEAKIEKASLLPALQVAHDQARTKAKKTGGMAKAIYEAGEVDLLKAIDVPSQLKGAHPERRHKVAFRYVRAHMGHLDSEAHLHHAYAHDRAVSQIVKNPDNRNSRGGLKQHASDLVDAHRAMGGAHLLHSEQKEGQKNLPEALPKSFFKSLEEMTDLEKADPKNLSYLRVHQAALQHHVALEKHGHGSEQAGIAIRRTYRAAKRHVRSLQMSPEGNRVAAQHYLEQAGNSGDHPHAQTAFHALAHAHMKHGVLDATGAGKKPKASDPRVMEANRQLAGAKWESKKAFTDEDVGLYIKENGMSNSKDKYEDLFKSELGGAPSGEKILIHCPHCDEPITKSQVLEKAKGSKGGVGSMPPAASTKRVKEHRPGKGVAAHPTTPPALTKGDGDSCSDDASSGDKLSKAGIPGQNVGRGHLIQWEDPSGDAALAKMIETGDIDRRVQVPTTLHLRTEEDPNTRGN